MFGERNSGTTFTEALLAGNLAMRVLPGGVPWLLYQGLPFEWVRDGWFYWTEKKNLGWKHGFPMENLIRDFAGKHPLAVVGVCKNPYSWLLSLYRNPYHLDGKCQTFTAFLKAPCSVVGREHAGEAFKNPIELWNAKNRAFFELSESELPVLLLRYEDILAEPEFSVERVASVCKLNRVKPFRGVELSTKGEKERHFEDYRSYYLDEKWRVELTEEDIERINRDIDSELCGKLGYAIICPETSEKEGAH